MILMRYTFDLQAEASLLLDSGRALCCAAAPPSKAGSVAGSIETAASIGSNAVASTLAVDSIGGGAETPGPAGLEELMRQLQEKYTLWQQRLDANAGQVGCNQSDSGFGKLF